MATIYSSDTNNNSLNQVKTSVAAKNSTYRTDNSFFIKSKVAMAESLQKELASVYAIRWK